MSLPLIFSGSITSSFSTKIEEHFLNPDPKLRPKTSSLLSDEIFKWDIPFFLYMHFDARLLYMINRVKPNHIPEELLWLSG